ncbi:MAG: divalent metal cation transporter, partial [Verrucomicrobiae bacterium]|nr:divalent metal cation transporter [Verrucomicrobiae bacterium]
PLAMILGVVMLSAIGYVAMSSGRRPFGAVNEHVSPVLGWAWLIAAMLANLVWCLPQFALGTGAIQQNLFPSLEKSDAATWGAGLALFVLAAIVVRAYDRDSRGVKLFELILKAMVGIVVISFFLVVGKMTLAGALDWGAILRGFVPNPAYLFKPAPAIAEAVAATGDHAAAWTEYILGTQKSKIIAGFGTAVGINMTFLLPYSMLRKGWGKEHRGLAIFDLSTGLIIPFMLATGCIVIAAGSQFHGKTDDILDASGAVIAGKEGGFNAVADTLVKKIHAADLKALAPEAAPAKIAEFRGRLSAEDRRVAAMLVDRKDRDLAKALAALAGEGTGRIVFGVGVLGMALSTIIILMLINGFCVCEALGRPGDRTAHFLGSLMPGLIGMCFPLIWTAQSRAALAVPTSVIGGSLLPIAYFTFLLLMNSKSLLGDAMPRGARRVRWNGLMIVATAAATFGSIWALKDQALGSLPLGKIGIGGLAALFVLGL